MVRDDNTGNSLDLWSLGADVVSFRSGMLVLDLLVAGLILLGVILTCKKLFWRKPTWQFSLRSLLIASFVVSLPLFWWVVQRNQETAYIHWVQTNFQICEWAPRVPDWLREWLGGDAFDWLPLHRISPKLWLGKESDPAESSSEASSSAEPLSARLTKGPDLAELQRKTGWNPEVEIVAPAEALSKFAAHATEPSTFRKLNLIGPTPESILALKSFPQVEVLQIGAAVDFVGRPVADFSRPILDLRPLRELVRLRLLTIETWPVNDESIEGWAGRMPLESLTIGQSRITDRGLRALEKFRGLKHLEIPGAWCTDEGLKSIGKLSELVELNLSRTAIHGPGLASLANLTKLRSLVLDDTDLDPDGLRFLPVLPHLTRLSLQETRVNESAWTAIERLPELLELNLSRTAIQELKLKGPATLQNVLLSGTAIPSARMAQFQMQHRVIAIEGSPEPRLADLVMATAAGTAPTNASLLQTVDFHATPLTDALFAKLSPDPKTRWLILNRTFLTDRSVALIHSMRELSELDIAATLISGASLKRLVDLRELSWIHLDNQQAHSALDALKQMPNLQRVYLRYVKGSPTLNECGDELRRALPNVEIEIEYD
ncbi:MAG TPA: hypothetical protein VFE24_10785 [Pirellulales bacterium]|nr:hypothetical protein [Pirellulales bacterium]